MKKGFLASLAIGFLMLGMVGQSSAVTIGNSVIDRGGIDTATNFTMIDTNLMFTENGLIDEWTVWTNGGSTIYLQTFEYISGDQYKLTGQNIVTTAGVGLNTFAISGVDQIQAKIGEFIGWTNPVGTIEFDYIGSPTNLNTGPVLFDVTANNITTVGDIFTANSSFLAGLNRTYSISANVSPTPEPATLFLLGFGVLGLAGVSRKRE